MTLLELLLIAVGLSMDAFAVSICKGLSMQKITINKSLIVGLYFGIFQGLMPLIGYYLGARFQDKIAFIDHWIAFGLLGFIGISMIKEAREKKTCPIDDSLSFNNMVILAIATSIDALAVGITFALLDVNISKSVLIIGLITFIISIVGVTIGFKFGSKFKEKAEMLGGEILILMGFKILLNHLGYINF